MKPGIAASPAGSSGIPRDAEGRALASLEARERDRRDDDVLGICAITEVLMGTDAPHRKIVEAFDVDSMESTATAFGLLHGAVLDLRRGWDLGDPVQVRRLWALLESSRPLLVIGSPVSTRSEKHYEEHLKTCMAVYRWQHEDGRRFLHEHKEGALSLSKTT